MATKFSTRYCERHEERTRHKIEYNNDTGWRRETCMRCWNEAVDQSSDSIEGDAD